MNGGWKRKSEWTLAVLLLLAALIPRLYRLDLMEFKGDEACAWISAEACASGLRFPWVGLVSSRGIENFPLFIHLLAIPALFSFSPVALAGAIAILNSLMVLPLYAAARRLLGKPTAFAGVLLFAVSPAAIFLSRSIFAQDLMQAWGIGLFYVMERLSAPAEKDGAASRAPAFFFGLLCATAPQIHLSGLFLAVACLAAMMAVLRIASKEAFAAGIGILAGILLSLPWWLWHFRAPAVFFGKLQGAVPQHPSFQPLNAVLFFLSPNRR